MWKHNEEAVNAVEIFNERVVDAIGMEREFSSEHTMKMTTDGSDTIIEFMGIVLWSSANDERQYLEDKDVYEPLLGFLERKFKQHLEFFSRLFKTEEE